MSLLSKTAFRKLNIFPIALVSILFLLSSCLSRKETTYFQKIDKKNATEDTLSLQPIFEPKIQKNDILQIQVASINPEAASFFNPTDNINGTPEANLTSYMVDLNGEIEIPLVGKIKVEGMTTREFRDVLRIKLEKYLQSPTVRVNYSSFKVTLLGEVLQPGLYQATNEKLTLTEALGLAGDLTIYGDRKNILLIRDHEGTKSFNYINLTNRDIFKSELFYVHPGDVIYVPPGKGKVASADAFYRLAPIILSSLTLLVLIARLNIK